MNRKELFEISLPTFIFLFHDGVSFRVCFYGKNNTNNPNNEGTRARMFYAESKIRLSLSFGSEEIKKRKFLYPSEVSLINQQHVCAGRNTLKEEREWVNIASKLFRRLSCWTSVCVCLLEIGWERSRRLEFSLNFFFHFSAHVEYFHKHSWDGQEEEEIIKKLKDRLRVGMNTLTADHTCVKWLFQLLTVAFSLALKFSHKKFSLRSTSLTYHQNMPPWHKKRA